MKESKKLMKSISNIANFKCNKRSCTDGPFFRKIKETERCLSAEMKMIQISLLIEQAEKR